MRITQSRVPAIEPGEASIEAIATAYIVLGGDLGQGGPPRSQAAVRRKAWRSPRSTGPVARPPLMAGRKRLKPVEA